MHDKLRWGSGTPEGNVWAQAATLYLRLDTGQVYRKTTTSGAAGWVDMGSSSSSGTRGPEWQSVNAWTDDPGYCSAEYRPGSGNLMLGLARVTKAVAAGGSLSALYYITQAAASLTYGRVVVYRLSDGAQVGVSADMSAAWVTTGAYSTPLPVANGVNAGEYVYIGILAVGTTSPALSAAGASVAQFTAPLKLGSANAPFMRGVIPGQTAVPASIGALGSGNATTQVPWFALA